MALDKRTRGVTSASRDTLIQILETLPDALYVIDSDARIVYANERAQVLAGSSREHIYGKVLWRHVPQLTSPALYQAVQKTMQTREPTEVAYISPATNLRLHASLSHTDEGLSIFIREDSDPQHLQDFYRQDEQIYRNLLEGFVGGVMILTPEGLILDINQRPLVDARIQREKVIGKPFADLPAWSYDPAVQQRLRAAIERAGKGENVQFEARIHPRDDLYLDILTTITPHYNGRQQVVYLICAGQDITEHKQIEKELRALVDDIPQFVWMAGPDGAITYNNQRLIDYLAMLHEQAEGNGWMVAVHPDDLPGVRKLWRSSVRKGVPYEVEHRLRDGASGAYRWFLVRGVPQRDARGTIRSWIGSCTDIDEQKRIEEALRQSQEQANVLMSSSIIGINISEGEQIVSANDTFLRMTGYTRDDLRNGKINWMHMTPPEYVDRTRQAHRELDTQPAMTPYEKEYICKDGSHLPVIVGRVTLPCNPSQGIAFVLDNTARKELERRKDDFINMASHELGNPLTAVKMQLSLMRRQLTRQGLQVPVSAFSLMETQLNIISRLIDELLDVSRIQNGKLEYRREMVDIDELLHEIIDTLQQINPDHTIRVSGTATIRLMSDRDRLGQVFTNLISNAIKYSPNAETVEIDLDASSETITIRVHDHGLGIPREQCDKIFERFYRVSTLRQKSIPGLGMGLYIVAEIVKHYGGVISVDSEIGKGSTFTVTLPIKDASDSHC
ncbi:hypothetical protein KDH_79190 [Dictyobacter sp. S3.2.2.5]|uniref:histidine kinase n=1 Tax=Dictyobacter halimunensis TaxID=3026934 RepID=A0ABQ6G6A6_9CHLR|nr:hypothetical protein KDH_79190 [Dictyobacter sp. S3.2.2.5]